MIRFSAFLPVNDIWFKYTGYIFSAPQNGQVVLILGKIYTVDQFIFVAKNSRSHVHADDIMLEVSTRDPISARTLAGWILYSQEQKNDLWPA